MSKPLIISMCNGALVHTRLLMGNDALLGRQSSDCGKFTGGNMNQKF